MNMYLALGFTLLGIGALGLVLPLLPTTPFVLLAAVCFARASPRWHRWLLQNPTFGPMVRNWERRRCISRRAKLIAISTMVAVGGSSLAFAVQSVPGRAIGGLLLIAGLLTVSLIRTCER